MTRSPSRQPLDLNLLVTLDALLSEGSVAGAANRMNLSPPAMSRQLARIRHLMNDPVLVRAGRGLVATPRAEAVRAQVRQLVQDAEGLVRGNADLDPATIERTFTIRSSDGFVGTFGAAIVELVVQQAPNARLRFVGEGNEDVDSLRDGRVDLDIGVIDGMGPEIRLQTLFRDRYIGVVRADHPLAQETVTIENFVAYPHVSVSRRGRFEGPVDTALALQGMRRTVSVAVANVADGLSIVSRSDHIVLLPGRIAAWYRRDFHGFELPVVTDELPPISIAWHPRFEKDAAHRWLRTCVREGAL
ncbi:LysR family transcriptional regulator [Rhodopseudomonas palustris]|uniref:Transcriptional regulator, LysR family n=1 Tax=Rhodopseudomonas palustris (strain BisB18) TaxID=316056 RepID=Q210Z5_RHOPB